MTYPRNDIFRPIFDSFDEVLIRVKSWGSIIIEGKRGFTKVEARSDTLEDAVVRFLRKDEVTRISEKIADEARNYGHPDEFRDKVREILG